jgi:pimeloyl-ACP methyl ester carboxylesterase
LVLVHGGGLTVDSCGLTVDEIHRQEPELTVTTLDIPARRNKPGDLTQLTIADYVDSLVDDIESAGLKDIVIVGHSIGGMTLRGAVTKLGAARVREMILAAAFLPPEGTSIVDSSSWLLEGIARRRAKKAVPSEAPK